MSFEATAKAIRAQFLAAFHAAEPTVPVGFDNFADLLTSGGAYIETPLSGVSADPAAWVRLAIRPASAEQVSLGRIGGRVWRQTGVVMVQVFTQAGLRDGRSNAIADAAAAALRGVNAAGVVLQAPRGPLHVGEEAGWYHVSVSVPYHYDMTA